MPLIPFDDMPSSGRLPPGSFTDDGTWIAPVSNPGAAASLGVPSLSQNTAIALARQILSLDVPDTDKPGQLALAHLLQAAAMAAPAHGEKAEKA